MYKTVAPSTRDVPSFLRCRLPAASANARLLGENDLATWAVVREGADTGDLEDLPSSVRQNLVLEWLGAALAIAAARIQSPKAKRVGRGGSL